MKKNIIKIIIVLIIIIALIVIIIERNLVQKTNDFMFYLEEKYYGSSVFTEINSDELTNLINLVRNKESAFEPGIVEKNCNLYNKTKENTN